MNVVSAISSGIAILTFALEVQYGLYRLYGKYESACTYPLRLHSIGISGLLLVLSFLQFIISIILSSFACKAICFCLPRVDPHEPFYSLPVPLSNCSSTVDYVNMNMTSVVNGHRVLPPTPRDKTNQKNETEYEQPTFD
ncbi:Membrane-spanning 4-domains subfamily A member 4A [Labeo rohita]|uniref:Membrane-spanning 4-domains subfamily A member 4A n=1 Tax=Labeo rohita TaxID=84645 RepID=A0ABQ8MKR5_LABRO|nr:Membrane-spanning 4-domains subfamily A member 4A [Labeo rohita]